MSSASTKEYIFRGEFKSDGGKIYRYKMPTITHSVAMVGTTRIVYNSNRLTFNRVAKHFNVRFEFKNLKKHLSGVWKHDQADISVFKINPFRHTLKYVVPVFNYDNGRNVRIVHDVPFVIHFTKDGWDKLIRYLALIYREQN
jgi:hypothetical protein